MPGVPVPGVSGGDVTELPAPTWRSECGRASLYVGDALTVLRTLPDAFVQCVVTSPPYWGLRDYGTGQWEGGAAECDHLGEPMRTRAHVNQNCGTGVDRKNAEGREPMGRVCTKCGAQRIDSQLGLEPMPNEYVAAMVDVFREVRRVLRDDGTLWLNLGDKYVDKCLCTIPWRTALALQADGWYLRQDIIWHKPNPMPESVTDRCTKAHEYIFLLSKAARYYFDAEAIKEPQSLGTYERYGDGKAPRKITAKAYLAEPGKVLANADYKNKTPDAILPDGKRNKRSVWTVPTFGYLNAHFATFPPNLIEPCILAGAAAKCCAECGTPWERMTECTRSFESGSGRSDNPIRGKQDPVQGGGETLDIRRGPVVHSKTIGWQPACKCNTMDTQASIVLDPFSGSGTTMQVAHKHGCRSIGIELNPEYADLCVKRIDQDLRQARLFA